ncbi:hypothetical protein B7P43_G07635 [Cryptotermes secundus]|uniref:Uncharacterized protein n=1 Tax=Cryptotermes secundus TaxID=105785 RepID=A0A2J7RLC4_9NEOP|nr:hypothetical protein B7P43_G07635 [Cryptotermes secundus]
MLTFLSTIHFKQALGSLVKLRACAINRTTTHEPGATRVPHPHHIMTMVYGTVETTLYEQKQDT